MARVNTKERILQCSLELFNAHGEANVTTNSIADELDISPGNLHYHFKRKRDIIDQLFGRYQTRLEAVMLDSMADSGDAPLSDLEDLWWYLHIIFEAMGEYRFLYRDLNDLLGRHQHLARPFRQLLGRKRGSALAICEGLTDSGIMQADPVELQTLADNIVLVMIYWLPFSDVAQTDERDGNILARAVYQVISLALPYLREPERSYSRTLALSYLE